MREIRFRIWDSHNEEMTTEPAYIDFNCGDWCVFSEKHKDWFSEGLLPMQFTGLKDKNGKEIYEGDVLKTPSLTTPGYGLGVVEYNPATCGYVKRYGKFSFTRLDVRLSEVEVVTNIYEAHKLKHSDRSCSLEAQGYNEQECKEIGDCDYLAAQCLELIEKIYEHPHLLVK